MLLTRSTTFLGKATAYLGFWFRGRLIKRATLNGNHKLQKKKFSIKPLAPNDMSYRTANHQTLHFKYLLNKYTY